MVRYTQQFIPCDQCFGLGFYIWDFETQILSNFLQVMFKLEILTRCKKNISAFSWVKLTRLSSEGLCKYMLYQWFTSFCPIGAQLKF